MPFDLILKMSVMVIQLVCPWMDTSWACSLLAEWNALVGWKVFFSFCLCALHSYSSWHEVHTSLIFTVFIISDSSQGRHKHTHASLWLISPRATYPCPPVFKISMVLSIFIWSFDSKDELKLWDHWDMLTDSLLKVTRAVQFLLVNLHSASQWLQN